MTDELKSFGLKRTFFKRPGYDCIRNPCGKNGCGTNPGSGHGVHCEEWVFVVSDGQRALCLEVWSGIYPDSVPASSVHDMSRYPVGAYLCAHLSFPSERDQVLDAPRECEYVDGGRCWPITYSISSAENLVPRSSSLVPGTTECPSPSAEVLFLKLEFKFVEWMSEWIPSEYARCPTCDGCGTVRRPSPPSKVLPSTELT